MTCHIMAMLLFYVGEHRFAIECAAILRVIPHVIIKKMPESPAAVAGLLVWGDQPVPIIDFCQLIEKRPSRPFINSRIILLKDESHSERYAGLLGEKVDEILDIQPKQFTKEEYYLQNFPYIDQGYPDQEGLIHHLNVEKFFHYLSQEVFHEFRT